MSTLNTIIKSEYLQNIRKKSFIITTLTIPLLLGIIIFLNHDIGNQSTPNVDATEISNSDITISIISVFSLIIWTFIMMSGGQIFNSVRFEKTNRIIEIILSSVSPIKFMLAKIISVGLVVLTQMLIWLILAAIIFAFILNDSNSISMESVSILSTSNILPLIIKNIPYLLFGVLSFVGGFILYGSLYAAMGSLLDADNENQTYILIITVILLSSMSATIGVIAEPDLWFADIITFLPFTSPIALSARISQGIPMWHAVIAYAILYASAALSLFVSGKIYSSGILLKGGNVSFSNIIAFIKR